MTSLSHLPASMWPRKSQREMPGTPGPTQRRAAFQWFMAMLLALAVAGCGDDDRGALARPHSMSPTVGSTEGGDSVAIFGTAFTQGSLVLFDGVPASDVLIGTRIIMSKTPAHEAGSVQVTVVDPFGRMVNVPGSFDYATPLSQEGGPRLLAAISLGNTSVRVNFSEPVAAGADQPSSYSIVQTSVNPESGVLQVLGAELGGDGLSALLTTGSQNEVSYTLTASDIRDVGGELLAPPEAFLNPSQVKFAGTPPAANGTLLDTDGDGVADNVEQSGWTVTVQLLDGDILTSTVTSEPTLADTDGDGLDDGHELLAGSNPRNADTDGDGITDLEELDRWHSGPTRADSDKDGLSDAAELGFETSPILADTDGDGMTDRDELFLFNRSPLLANLPRPQIIVGDYSLQVKVTSSFTDVTGTTHSSQSTMHTGVSQVQAKAINRSDTRSTETANKQSQQFGIEAGLDGKKFVGKISASFGFEQSSARGFSSTIETQTASQSQQVYEKSVSDGFDRSELQSVTRTVDAASMQVDINVANQGEVPFTITNLEISVLRQDRANGGAFTPVASLLPTAEQGLAFNLGPFDTERGPIVLENTDIFPNVVEELIREPQGLVFKVGNFDVLDAEGKNFAFSAATVSSRTAGLTIDFGDGRVEDFRIATHNAFGKDGLPTGISMQRALQIAGFALNAEDTALPDPLPARLDAKVNDSVGTLRQGTEADGPERLVRVRGVQNDLRGLARPEKRFWTVLTNDVGIDQDADFSSIQLHAGDEFLLLYTRDLDQDGLHELEENLYGSSDASADTDGDGLLDAEEVRDGWLVHVNLEPPRRVFPSPARADSDGDGLDDAAEREHGTDPNRRDTDNDGLGDRLEILEALSLPLGEQNAPDRRLLRLSPYSDAAIFAVTDGTVGTAAEGDDEQLIAVGAPVLAGAAVVGPGPNGRIDSLVPSGGVEVFAAPSNVVAGPSGDPALAPGSSKCETAVDASTTDVQLVPAGTVVPEGTLCITGGPPDFFVHTEVALGSSDFVRVGHERRFTLDPTSSDTDRDDISDGRETRIGLNPDANDSARFVDTDQDGLSDALEQAGWDACVANTCRHVKPSTVLADSDLDGLPDVLEHAIRSDPWRSDTDGDQLSDLEEFDLNNPVYPSFDAELHVVGTLRYYDQPSLDEAKRRCAGAAGCRLPSTSLTHTNPTATDSDGDGRSDYQEHYQSVIIYIDGKYARAAFSDPNLRDTDYDRLDDATELAQKTDPTSTDSDGDATDDRVELLSSEPLRRDPLTKDRLITLRYDRITWHDVDCWLLDDEEWTWNLQYQASENAAVQSYAQQVSAVEMDTNETSTVTTITGTPVRFVVKFSQSVILRGTLEEYDTDGVDSSYEYSENLLVSELELGDHVHEYTMNACGGTMVVTAAIAAE